MQKSGPVGKQSERNQTVELDGESLRLDAVLAIAAGAKVSVAEVAFQRMRASRDYIESRMSAGEVIYGVNTGFGAFSSVRIDQKQIEELQVNLIRSHSVGVGPRFSRMQSRAIMALRANALVRGHSGIRTAVVEKLIEFLNLDVVPVIPEQGSVGASGDLAPLSHLALALIGEGEVFAPGSDQVRSCVDVLAELGIQPLVLKAKEGLSLINGCQVMTAVGLLALEKARRLALLVDVAGAMTLEALRGTRAAFDPLIPATRRHLGEAITARNLLRILGSTSAIAESHLDCGRVQDAYSLRCMPAVHGAAKDALRRGLDVLEIEANSSTDNPLVFAEDGKVLSCGNFHGEPVAFQLDFMGIAVAAMASISECRIEKLINPAMSGLPAFLAPHGGLNSGHMIVQVSAASLVSENKVLAHPASVDSIPTSADKEDHVSMGTIAARKFHRIVENAESIVSMELLSASQALDLVRREYGSELNPSAGVARAYDVIRSQVPFAEHDRIFGRDIEAVRSLILDNSILTAVEREVGGLEL